MDKMDVGLTDNSNSITITIAIMRKQMSPAFLYAMNLVDKNGQDVTPILPLKINDTDPPVVISAKSGLNAMYHFNSGKTAVDELKKKERYNWLQKIKMLPAIFQLMGIVSAQFKSMVNFFKTTSDLLHKDAEEVKEHTKKQPIAPLVSTIKTNIPTELAAAEKKLNDFYTSIKTTDFKKISVEQKQNILELYKNHFMSNYPSVLTNTILFETKNGLATGSISNYVLQEAEKIHQIMVANYQEKAPELAPLETLNIPAVARKDAISKTKEQYIETKATVELLHDFIKFMKDNSNINLQNLTQEQHKKIKEKYLPIRSYLTVYAPKYDEFLMQEPPYDNKYCAEFLEPLEMLLQNCKDVANENYFSYVELLGIASEKPDFTDDIKQTILYKQKQKAENANMKNIPNQVQLRRYQEDKTKLNLALNAIIEADKLAKLREKLEQEIKKSLGSNILKQLNLDKDNKIKLPYSMNSSDYPHTKCIKALFNSLYHSEQGLRYYAKSASSGFFAKIWSYLLTFFHMNKATQNIGKLEQKSRLITKENYIDAIELTNFAESIADVSGKLLANIFEKTSSNLSIYSNTPEVENIFNKFSIMFAELSTLDSKSTEFRQKLLNEFEDAIRFIDKLKNSLSQSSKQTQELDALKKFYPIIEKIILKDNGQIQATTAPAIQKWLDNNWLNLMDCLDRMEEHYGFRNGAISAPLEKAMQNLIQTATNKGVNLHLPNELAKDRSLKTKAAIIDYKKQYHDCEDLPQKINQFFEVIKEYMKNGLINNNIRSRLLNHYQYLSALIATLDPTFHSRFINEIIKSEGKKMSFQDTCLNNTNSLKEKLIDYVNEKKLLSKMKLNLAEFKTLSPKDNVPPPDEPRNTKQI